MSVFDIRTEIDRANAALGIVAPESYGVEYVQGGRRLFTACHSLYNAQQIAGRLNGKVIVTVHYGRG